MSKKSKEPDEMRMPAYEFDKAMRKALGVPAPKVAPAKDKSTSKKISWKR